MQFGRYVLEAGGAASFAERRGGFRGQPLPQARGEQRVPLVASMRRYSGLLSETCRNNACRGGGASSRGASRGQSAAARATWATASAMALVTRAFTSG